MGAHAEDHVWTARVFWALILVVGVILIFKPFGWTESSATAKPDWHKAHCYKIPAKYHGGLYCSDDQGNMHGYVNPGSMEWEVE